MDNKKDNSSLWIIVAFVCLVVSCASSIYIHKTTTSLVTNSDVLAVTNPKEFVASAEGIYENGILTVEIQTNAPSGSIFEVYAQHPALPEPLIAKAAINRGIGTVEIPLDATLPTNFLTINAVLDMTKQEGKAGTVTAKRYGEVGEQMTGNYVFTEDGVYFNGVSNIGIVPYPSKEVIREIQKGMFADYMYYLCQTYPQLFYAIQPDAQSGEWDNITVVLSDEANNEWDTLDVEQKANFFSIFEIDPKAYYVVDEDVDIKVAIEGIDGNIIAKNY